MDHQYLHIDIDRICSSWGKNSPYAGVENVLLYRAYPLCDRLRAMRAQQHLFRNDYRSDISGDRSFDHGPLTSSDYLGDISSPSKRQGPRTLCQYELCFFSHRTSCRRELNAIFQLEIYFLGQYSRGCHWTDPRMGHRPSL